MRRREIKEEQWQAHVCVCAGKEREFTSVSSVAVVSDSGRDDVKERIFDHYREEVTTTGLISVSESGWEERRKEKEERERREKREERRDTFGVPSMLTA